MASLLSTRMPIVRLATPLLQEITAQCDETALLGLYLPDRRQMIFAAKVDSRHPVRYVLEMNVPLSPCWGATGRGILAYLPESEIDQILSPEERSLVTGEVINADAVRRELAEIRQRGYAFTHGQRIPGAVGIAVPYMLISNQAHSTKGRSKR
jgi:DNA-binding IclR family transcriptional regulator